MSRIHVDSLVFIRPTHSLKFGKYWGRVIAISENDELPLKIAFDNLANLYGFTHNEVMTPREVREWDSDTDNHYCYKCGADTKGMYVSICEDCEYPLPEEGD